MVSVEVTARWKGFDINLVQCNNGVVHARVGPGPAQQPMVERGEIPEIVMVDRGEYHGTFRWEDLEDIQMVEKDLKK